MAPLDEQILQIAREQGRVTMAGVVRLLETNRNTVKVHLRQLVTGGHLVMHGRGKGAWYAPL
jgi:predicted HTH transcriptional regulator